MKEEQYCNQKSSCFLSVLLSDGCCVCVDAKETCSTFSAAL